MEAPGGGAVPDLAGRAGPGKPLDVRAGPRFLAEASTGADRPAARWLPWPGAPGKVPAVAHRPHILVVDDDVALLENISECLAGEGFEVSVARDAAGALLRLAAPPRPALLIVDHFMPGMTGAELVACVRREPALAGMRLVLISGLPPARGAAGLEAEADAVLEKPFGVERLIVTVRRQLAAA
jgi:CheY-like chemotaxis protein